jgi:hypothetical protein
MSRVLRGLNYVVTETVKFCVNRNKNYNNINIQGTHASASPLPGVARHYGSSIHAWFVIRGRGSFTAND